MSAPTHPSPAEMAREAIRTSATAPATTRESHDEARAHLADGIRLERARLALHLRTLVDGHVAALRAPCDSSDIGAQLTRAERTGAGVALLDLARELDAEPSPPLAALHACTSCGRHPTTHPFAEGDDKCGACGLGDER